MKKQMQNRYERVSKQVEEMRRLYTRIGEPLPTDIIIDLHHHLGAALEQGDAAKAAGRILKHRAQA